MQDGGTSANVLLRQINRNICSFSYFILAQNVKLFNEAPWLNFNSMYGIIIFIPYFIYILKAYFSSYNTAVAKIIWTVVFSPAKKKKKVLSQLFLSFSVVCQ